MKNMDKVSVVIPAYNSQDTIIGCVESVVNQTYKNIEIIVVDDGSTDNTIELLCAFNVHIENKIHIIKQTNQGPSCARNAGVNYAQGNYIAFLDSDDEWYPEKIEKQMQLYQENNEAVLIGCLYSIGNKYPYQKRFPIVQQIALKKLLFKNSFITSTVICPRNILCNYQFNKKQKYSEDYRLWLQIASLGKPCFLLNEVLTKMNDKPLWGAKGLSSKLWKMEKGELSNYRYLKKENLISYNLYVSTLIYSLLKFIRRLILTLLYHLQKIAHKK